MQFIKYAVRFSLIVIAAGILAGCATNSIPPERLKEYSAIQAGSNWSIYDIDKETFLSGGVLTAISISVDRDVLPGNHNVVLGGNCSQNGCVKRSYYFETVSGNRYTIRDSQIFVTDRFSNKQIDTLTTFGNNNYVTSEEADKIRAEMRQAANDAQAKKLAATNAMLAATNERRMKNLSMVRKIGARICQDRDNGYKYVGYVESVADEKVQIRVSEANVSGMGNYPLKGFSPSIIWDAPMNWDLCE